MKLTALMRDLWPRHHDQPPPPDPEIESIHYRAQEVSPGGLFVAIAGQHADGHAYVETALERGAAAVICQHPVSAPVPVIRVTDTRRALAEVSARFYGHPADRMTLIGITGTNGKTTTAYLIESILNTAGRRCGVIGTIGYRYPGRSTDLPMTTPESRDLQRILKEMADAAVTHVVMEVSSHALAQHRVWGCPFTVAVFTNLTQDHLDFHGTMSAYWESKKRLFTEYLAPGTDAAAVINADDPRGIELAAALLDQDPPPAIITTGGSADGTVQGQTTHAGRDGTEVLITEDRGETVIHSALIGRHNLENMLNAYGAGMALDIAPDTIASGIAALTSVPGRLQPVPTDDNRFILVDYAHTPDALENALGALRRIGTGRLICVFGCGGDRDTAKRSMMGAIAGQMADLSIITSDNPRSESPAAIIDQVLQGVRQSVSRRYRPTEISPRWSENGYGVEPNRRAAISLALKMSDANDTVLIAGKGHETYQILGDRTIAFDDRREAADAARAVPSTLPPVATDAPLAWTPERLLEATGGVPIGDIPTGADYDKIAIDSRTISPGAVFAAIRGDTHDGHQFVPEVLEKGIRAFVVDRRQTDALPSALSKDPRILCIAVADTVAALGRLAAYHRVRTGTPVVGLTGSNGKTTTREMTASVMAQRYHTLSTIGNFNNEIGLPLTLLELTPAHEWAVVEMGMNHPGEIDRLARLCAPAVGMITNIAPAHLEGLGTIDGVMRAKGELLGALAPDGHAVLNADDPRCLALAAESPCPVTTFGTVEGADVRGIDIAFHPTGMRFTLCLPGADQAVDLPVFGRFMVTNALAAAAVGWRLGLSPEAIACGLASFRPVRGRMTVTGTNRGFTLIDDTYNANPGSMAAALETLTALASGQPRIVVVGDMKELGDQSRALHRELGEWIGTAGVDYLYVTGDFAEAVAEGAAAARMPASAVFVGTIEDIQRGIRSHLDRRPWILVKGSRSMRMERISSVLIEWGDGPADHDATDAGRRDRQS